MGVERVDPAVPDSLEKMQRPAGSSQPGPELEERRQAEEVALGNTRGDAHDVLRHHAAGAQIEMSDFAVAHLSFRESYGEPAGVEQSVGERIPQAMPHGRAPELDGIAVLLLAISPAI